MHACRPMSNTLSLARPYIPLVAHQGTRRHLLNRNLAARVRTHLDLAHVQRGTKLRLQLTVPLVVPMLLALCLERCANLLGSAPRLFETRLLLPRHVLAGEARGRFLDMVLDGLFVLKQLLRIHLRNVLLCRCSRFASGTPPCIKAQPLCKRLYHSGL